MSPARLHSQNLRLNSSFPQRLTSFTLEHVKKLKNHPIVGNAGQLDKEIDLPGPDGFFRHRPFPEMCTGSSKGHRQFELVRAELQSNGYPSHAGSSRGRRQSDFVGAELPSNCCPTPSGSSLFLSLLQSTSAYLGRLVTSVLD